MSCGRHSSSEWSLCLSHHETYTLNPRDRQWIKHQCLFTHWIDRQTDITRRDDRSWRWRRWHTRQEEDRFASLTCESVVLYSWYLYGSSFGIHWRQSQLVVYSKRAVKMLHHSRQEKREDRPTDKLKRNQEVFVVQRFKTRHKPWILKYIQEKNMSWSLI